MNFSNLRCLAVGERNQNGDWLIRLGYHRFMDFDKVVLRDESYFDSGFKVYWRRRKSERLRVVPVADLPARAP